MTMSDLSDRDLVEHLIANEPDVIYDFFYRKCRPLLSRIQWIVFKNSLKYDEIADSFYLYLSTPDADGQPWAKLRMFQFRSTLYTWLKVVATRYFMRDQGYGRRHCQMVEIAEKHAAYTAESPVGAQIDIFSLLDKIPNDRYRMVIVSLILNDEDPNDVARKMGVTKDNLYNIKRRALLQLARLVGKEVIYG